VGESEARTITFESSPNPKSPGRAQAAQQAAARQKQALDELKIRVYGPSASANPQQRRQRAPAVRSVDRWEEYESLIAKAACKAGNNNLLFCKLLHQSGIPVPRRWKVKTWLAAFNKTDANNKHILQPSIRRFKSRHKSTS
jgi:hypothetical protein